MTEERKHAILFAATLLCARRIIETIESDKPNFRRGVFRRQGDSEGGPGRLR